MDLKNLSAQYLTNHEPEKAFELLIEHENSEDIDILNNLAISYILLNKKTQAALLFEKILKISPNNAQAYSALGNLYFEIGNIDKSKQIFQNALERKISDVMLYNNYARLLTSTTEFEQAVNVLNKALNIDNSNILTLKNITSCYLMQNNFELAKKYITTAIGFNDNNINLKLLLCNILETTQEYKELEKTALDILKHDKTNIDAKIYLATAASESGDFAKVYELLLNAKHETNKIMTILYLLLRAATFTCDVNKVAEISQLIKTRINSNNITEIKDPYYLLLISETSQEALTFAKLYSDNILANIKPIFKHNKNSNNKKIKLGYISPNFSEHAVGFILGDLFKLHDKNKFELIGILTYNPIQDFSRDIIYTFDKTIHLTDMPAKDMAIKINELELDILIDLTGHFSGSVVRALAYCPAKIQCHWVGYPGTLGSDCIQYFISDDNCIPRNDEKYYNEKIIKLNTFITAPKLVTPQKIATKGKYNLPEDKFVFCCHVREYRMSIELLDAWSEILNKTENSVIWLSFQNNLAKENIRNYLMLKGISNSRIIISSQMALSIDFAPIVADLWLDPFKMTSGVSTLICCQIGTPVLTLKGNIQHRRTGAAILKAAGVNELVTNSIQEYINKACELANNADNLMRIKQKLKNKNGLLFKPEELVKNLENKLIECYEKSI